MLSSAALLIVLKLFLTLQRNWHVTCLPKPLNVIKTILKSTNENTIPNLNLNIVFVDRWNLFRMTFKWCLENVAKIFVLKRA